MQKTSNRCDSGQTLLDIWGGIICQIVRGTRVRKGTTITINKVTVSFLSVERTGFALEGGLLFTVEIIMTYETVRTTRVRKVCQMH